MSQMHWTPGQAAAIGHRGGSLLVSAAAGSGKTAVLVERAVSLLADQTAPVQADRLLIVTFTNAAAAELRGRIAKRLGELIHRQPGNGALRRQQMLLQRAPIATIDAFCLALLQKNFSALEIPPDFATAEETALFAMRQTVLADVLERAYTDPDFCAFADLYGRGRSDAAAGGAVLALYDFLRSLPQPQKTLKEFCAAWESGAELEETAWCRELCSVAAARCQTMLGLAQMAQEQAQQSAAGGEKYLPAITADLAQLQALCDDVQKVLEHRPGAWQTVCARLDGWSWDKLAALRGGKDSFAQTAMDLRAEYKDIHKKLREDVFLCSAAEFESDRAAAAPLVRALARAVLDFDAAFWQAKVEEKVLEFSDFEHLTLKLLQNPDGTPTEAAARISADYDAVMVDEYQDTNALQDAIYRRLANAQGSNLFLVGDLKQSIYRFRQADPAVFLQKQDAWPPLILREQAGQAQNEQAQGEREQGGQAQNEQAQNEQAQGEREQGEQAQGERDQVGESVQSPTANSGSNAPLPQENATAAAAPKPPASLALDANFRSAPAVVDTVNFFFENLMSRALGGTDYGPGQALVAGAEMPELPFAQDPPDPGTHPPKPQEPKDSAAGEPATAAAAAASAAARANAKHDPAPARYSGRGEIALVRTSLPAGDAGVIAARIAKMVREGFLVRDGHAPGGVRPCDYGDFCILLRTRGSFGLYAAALESAGIPVYADVSENLLDAPQVRPLIALLQVLDNPAQDVPLASAMLSALFGFVPDDLVRLRVEIPRGSLYGAVVHSKDPAMQAFYARLSVLRRMARSLSVPELLEQLLADTGYLAAVGAMPGGERRRDDLRRFTAWASGAGQAGLSALIRRIETAQKTGGVSAGGGGQTRPGCVSIMTVHRSKGLEFPVVFVADTAHRFNQTDSNQSILFHRELGLGLCLRPEHGAGIYPTLAHRAVRQRQQTETLAEEMRILYVALTRAKDALIITVPLADPAKTLAALAPYCAPGAARGYKLSTAQNWAQWLLMAAMLHPDASSLRDASGMILAPAAARSPLAAAVLEGDAEQAETEQRRTLPTAAPDPALWAQLAQNFAWRYPRTILRSVPAKVSVTAVTHGERPTALQRPAFLYKEGLTGAERGTAVHAFLQSADLAAAAKDLPGEIERQESLQLLSPEIAQQLDSGVLETFFASPTFARMQSAQKVLREYAFITALPARFAMQDQTADYGGAKTLVQGVADVVLLFGDHIEILDYKTDRRCTPDSLVQAYGSQLRLYCHAVEKRFNLPVTRLTLYSFSLGREINVPKMPGEAPPQKARQSKNNA